jgi:hypothetical protein
MIYDIKKVKQLKLVTGEEILCEILEEDAVDVIIRNALSIQFHKLDDGSRLYTFNLFMCYQDDPDRLILLKLDKIVSVANPTEEFLGQYVSIVEKIFSSDDETEESYSFMDSDQGNVLKFPTFH